VSLVSSPLPCNRTSAIEHEKFRKLKAMSSSSKFDQQEPSSQTQTTGTGMMTRNKANTFSVLVSSHEVRAVKSEYSV
jgi:hypothetical protein